MTIDDGWRMRRVNHAIHVPNSCEGALRAFPMLDKALPLLDTQVIALDMMGRLDISSLACDETERPAGASFGTTRHQVEPSTF